MEGIDIVLPWVDDNDSEWRKERDKYKSSLQCDNSNTTSCFRDWDTLRYVFRGIEKNMPWVRYIHFITCGHLPSWLNSTHSKIKIHNHKDFFDPESALPTFSSHSIEMNFKNIPELSEKFIYFNDDTLVVKPVQPERFFKENKLIDYLVLDIPRYGWLYDHLRIKEAFGYICKNDIITVNKKYPLDDLVKTKPELFFDSSYNNMDRWRNRLFTTIGFFKWIKVNHNPQAFLLSNIKKCHDEFGDIINLTSSHRFRSTEDVNQYLYRFYALFKGAFIPHYFNDDFCFVLSSSKRYHKERKMLFRKTFVCLNDSVFLNDAEYHALKKQLNSDLNMLLSSKSSYEKNT